MNTNVRYLVPKITELPQMHIPDESICVPSVFAPPQKIVLTDVVEGVICVIKHATAFKEWTEQRTNGMETFGISLRPHKSPRHFTHINVGVVYHNADSNNLIEHICHCMDYIHYATADWHHLTERHLKANYRPKQIVTVHTRGDATLDKIDTNVSKLYR